jgi:hypothetical protein
MWTLKNDRTWNENVISLKPPQVNSFYQSWFRSGFIFPARRSEYRSTFHSRRNWHRRLALMEVCGQKLLVISNLDLPAPSIYCHKLRWTDSSAISWFVSGSRTQDSTLLISKPALGHDPEPFPCVSGYRCKTRLFNIHLNAVSFYVLFSEWGFSDNFLCRNSVSIPCLSYLSRVSIAL